MNQVTTSVGPRAGGDPSWPRFATMALGVWLFISAFLWPHSAVQMTNTWVCGLLAVVFAGIAAYAAARARYLNTLLAVWLLLSSFALVAHSVGTVWNNAIVALAIFVTSLIPGSGEAMSRPRRALA